MHHCITAKFGGGKFDEFGESWMIRRTKTIQIKSSSYWLIYYVVKLSFAKCSKESIRQTSPAKLPHHMICCS